MRYLLLLAIAVVLAERVQGMAISLSPCRYPQSSSLMSADLIRKVCDAINALSPEERDRMEAYLDDQMVMQMLRDSSMQRNGVKRQDVDHVFLRFGRRRR